MTDQESTPQLMINKIEREAIEYAQSMLTGPSTGQSDPLSKTEREAIAFAKKLLGMFKT